jgi:alpha-tubulin suppressor-like RCC1 family protein
MAPSGSGGGNGFGQLGLGEVGNQNSPTQLETGWVAIAAGGFHSFGLKANGSLYAWGYNCYGQLGVGDTADKHTPTLVGNGWVAVSGGFWPDYHSLGLQADGSIWAWGFNGDGQLGLGDTAERHSPTRVGTEVNWVGVAAGGWHSLGLQADGSLWAWGSGGGVPGLGNNANRLTPTKVPGFNESKVVVIPLD